MSKDLKLDDLFRFLKDATDFRFNCSENRTTKKLPYFIILVLDFT